MADITVTQATRNSSATWTTNAGAASQTLDMNAYRDENVIILVQNTDAVNAARVKFSTNGYGGLGGTDLDVDLTVSGGATPKKVIVLESMYYKAPATGKITFQVLDQDDTAFTGSEADVLVSAINLPKGVTI